MADSKLYRLREGAKHLVPRHDGTRALRPLEAGSTIELNARQAESLADKFEPVDGPAVAQPAPVNQTLDQDPDPSTSDDQEPEQVDGDLGYPDPAAILDQVTSPVDPSEYTVDELKAYIVDPSDPWTCEDLEALAKAEGLGDNRTGVRTAITKRIAHLSKE